jgi:hypothetical protein
MLSLSQLATEINGLLIQHGIQANIGAEDLILTDKTIWDTFAWTRIPALPAVGRRTSGQWQILHSY